MELTVPAHHELFNPLLRATRALGGSAAIAELNEATISLLGLAPEDIDRPHRGRGTEVEYRLVWARTYLKSFGLLTNSERGVWSLTAAGQETERVVPVDAVRFVRERVKERKQGMGVEEGAPEDLEEPALAERILEESWRDELLRLVREMPAPAFERLCQRLLRESGFLEVNITGWSGDGGIDGVGIVRIGGLLGFPVLFQCKRYEGTVSAGAVRDFRGAMVGRTDRGLLITAGTFSRETHKEATRDGAPPIDLLDAEQLLDKLKELRLGVLVQQIESVRVLPEWIKAI